MRNTGGQFSLENVRNILLQLSFLYFSSFIKFQQILLSEAGVRLLRRDLTFPYRDFGWSSSISNRSCIVSYSYWSRWYSKEILQVYQQCQVRCFSRFLICHPKEDSKSFMCYCFATTYIYVNSSFIEFPLVVSSNIVYIRSNRPLLPSCYNYCYIPSGAYFHLSQLE